MPGERGFDEADLSDFDGSDGPAYVAYRGEVYDVSGSFLWSGGVHMVVHCAGADQTGALESAPHGDEVLDRFPCVGTLGSGD